jgi:imidazolonepropionase-like amidohydrolase
MRGIRHTLSKPPLRLAGVMTAAALSALLALSLGAPPAKAAPVEDRYVILANGEQVGHLTAAREDNVVSIDFAVSNNGRGPKNRQRLVLDPANIPLEWSIEGASTFGGPVAEHMRQSDGVLEWTSQSDSGSVPAPHPTLYIAGDDSPWSLGLYARALLADEDHSLEVAPGGVVRLDKVRDVSLDGGGQQTDGIVYRLTGLDVAPSYIILDAGGRLLAHLSSGQFTILEPLRDEVPRLQSMARDFELERVRAIQSQVAHRFDAPVRIRNVRIFDPTSGKVGPLVSVTVFDSRISTIEPETGQMARPDEYVIDGQGGVLTPGLHDMHAHTSLQNGLFYLAAGVTSVRDMGNNNAFLPHLIEGIESGELPGPRIVPSGLLEGRSPYSARNGIVADTLKEALQGVRWYADRGYFQLKIYNSLHPEWLAPAVAEAHRLGLGVTGHIPAFVTPDQAIEAGYDEIAHINQLMLGWVLDPTDDTRTPLRLTGMMRAATLDLNGPRVQHTLALMREHDTALDTTAVTLELLMTSRSGVTSPTAVAHADHMPIGYQRMRKRAFVTVSSPEEDAAYMAAFQKLLDTLALLHANDVQLLPGTDAANGFTVHRELELYVKAGIAPAEALRLGTLAADQYMNRDQILGSIERGKQADFILTPGDPTQDITALHQIRLVMKGGVAYLPSEIYDALGVRPFADPVSIMPPSQPASTAAPVEAGDDFLFGPDGHDEHGH